MELQSLINNVNPFFFPQVHTVLEIVQNVEILLNVSAANVTALQIELAPQDPTKSVWIGEFAIFACLNPFGR